eukprot:5591221-Alexandrium_andersonii.AAC.1
MHARTLECSPTHADHRCIHAWTHARNSQTHEGTDARMRENVGAQRHRNTDTHTQGLSATLSCTRTHVRT